MELKKCEVCQGEFKNLSVHKRKHEMKTDKILIQNASEIISDKNPEGSGVQPVVGGESLSVKVSALETKLDKTIESLNTIANTLKVLVEDKKEPVPTPVVASPSFSSIQPNASISDVEHFEKAGVIPPKFRQVIDEILSPDFEIQLEYSEDMPNYYTLHIFVPEKYSSVPKEHRAKGVKDIRSRVIPMTHGTNGVRDWATLVRKNLNNYFVKSGVASPFNNQ